MIEPIILRKGAKRVWILGDLHFGVRANSVEWLEIQKQFFEEVFIPTLKKHVQPGDVLVQVGDTFDNRQSINIKVLNYAVNLFEKLGKILPVHIICGNHDIWAKGSNEVTSIDSLKWIPNIQIYKEPKLMEWSGKKILMMPWRRDAEHEAETLAEYPTADIVYCHSEVRGIYLNAKVKNDHGTDSNIYDKYMRVYSGHIHFRQNKGKLLMVGTPYQLTRSDSNNTKGFDLVNLEDLSETFFQNDVSPKFLKYNLTQLYDMPLGQFKNQIKNNFIDLFVPSKIATTNALGKLINKIQQIGRKLEPNIYQEENYIDKDFHDMDQVEEMYKDYNILNLCNMYVDGLNEDPQAKERLKNKLKQLYTQCAYNYDIEQ
jgi:DNA repair exonuclease SbcCD nuclease subunit|tara:strand:- start:1669 stop:2784 length:1116 start_codon:yes stop_codon:yes gene_type:complete